MTIAMSAGTKCPDSDFLSMMDNSKRFNLHHRRASVEGAILLALILALAFLAVGYY